MSIPLIIGRDIITQGSVTCNRDGISLTKTPQADIFTNCINVCELEDEIDLNHIVDRNIRRSVTIIVKTYQPTEVKSTESIVLTDNTPVYQRRVECLLLKKK